MKSLWVIPIVISLIGIVSNFTGIRDSMKCIHRKNATVYDYDSEEISQRAFYLYKNGKGSYILSCVIPFTSDANVSIEEPYETQIILSKDSGLCHVLTEHECADAYEKMYSCIFFIFSMIACGSIFGNYEKNDDDHDVKHHNKNKNNKDIFV
jgi:hypothetical protein